METEIFLRRITLDDVDDTYLKWMNDPAITNYLESRFLIHTIDSLKKYVTENTNQYNYLYCIIDKSTQKHIGNIQIRNINPNHLYGEMGYLLGEKEYSKKGIITKAAKEIIKIAFAELKLHKLISTVYSKNIGSIRVLEKSGFILEGCERKVCLYENDWIDRFIYGLINDNF